jgi:hypothetical protein
MLCSQIGTITDAEVNRPGFAGGSNS